jgi:hypothetical protein
MWNARRSKAKADARATAANAPKKTTGPTGPNIVPGTERRVIGTATSSRILTSNNTMESTNVSLSSSHVPGLSVEELLAATPRAIRRAGKRLRSTDFSSNTNGSALISASSFAQQMDDAAIEQEVNAIGNNEKKVTFEAAPALASISTTTATPITTATTDAIAATLTPTSLPVITMGADDLMLRPMRKRRGDRQPTQ